MILLDVGGQTDRLKMRSHARRTVVTVTSFLRRISTRRLIALRAALVAVAAAGTAIAVAASSGGPVPPRKSLATAIHDALAAPDAQGVTADVTFTNHLIDGLDLRGSNPILSGAHGRLWATDD